MVRNQQQHFMLDIIIRGSLFPMFFSMMVDFNAHRLNSAHRIHWTCNEYNNNSDDDGNDIQARALLTLSYSRLSAPFTLRVWFSNICITTIRMACVLYCPFHHYIPCGCGLPLTGSLAHNS